MTAAATANARMAGASRVPERTSLSWPPPCSTGTGWTPRASSSAPAPTGPPNLCPVTVIASAPLPAKLTGSWPAACTASVWNGMPCSRASAASSAIGCTAPTSLLAHITVTRATASGSAADGLGQRGGLEHPGLVHRQPVLLGVLVPGQPVHRVQHRVVLDRGGQHPAGRGVGASAGPVRPRGAPSTGP